jgi:crotonobetainyl-CoA:carnitine CoA-transferase CaiB-like acyl-CoA transferase
LLGLTAGPIVPADIAPPEPFSVLRGGPRRVRARPLVLDLTALWAGPLCAHLLGRTGARVVKVESVTRPDGSRAGPAAFFDLLHAGHESVVLDLGTPAGRAALRALAAAADVVLEASRPRALRRLGLEAGEYVAAGTTWTSITAYGRGPGADLAGFGDDVAAAAGLVAWDRGEPLPCGDALADPLAGVHAAVATVAALHDSAAHLLDVSMHRVAAAAARPWPAGTAPADQAAEQAAEQAAAEPRARRPAGRGPRFGEHTGAVLAEFGVRV